MEDIRIAVLDINDNVLTFMDNMAPGALHYYDDKLHEYLSGSAYTYEFTCPADHDDSQYIVVGNKLGFIYREKGYYLTIVQTEHTEEEIAVTAYGLLLELLNEQTGAYSASSAMSFEAYIKAFNFASGTIVLGINEVSDKRITNEWTGTETILSRLYSLANVFSAEIEFTAQMSDNYSVERLVMNVYKEHDYDNGVQGMGTDRTDEITLRYGMDIKGITKKSDITELYTAIRPFGTDDLTVSSLNKYEYDDDGIVEYQSPSGDRNIYAVQAKEQFPSNMMADVYDKYICKIWEYETENVNTLYGQALAQLKKYCVPQVEYTVEGYFDTGIGDTVRIEDSEYNPSLYLTARVTEQVRSFTDPAQNSTTFSNFRESESGIDSALLEKMNALIEANKTYTCSISTDNGFMFKNNEGETTLTASVKNGSVDVTSDMTVTWYKDGEELTSGVSITVSAGDIDGKAVYSFEAADTDGTVRGSYECTLVNVSDGTDGTDGQDGTDGADGISPVITVNEDSSLTIVDAEGEKTTDILKGADGADGEDGTDGVGISSIVTQYYLSSSDTACEDGSWEDEMPAWESGYYIWTRSYIVWDDDSTSVTTAVLAEALNSANETAAAAQEKTTVLVDQMTEVTERIDAYEVSVSETYATKVEVTNEIAESVGDSDVTSETDEITQDLLVDENGDPLTVYDALVKIASYLTQTSSSLSIEFETVSSDLEALTSGDIADLKADSEAYQAKLSYVNITNEPAIVLGASDSDFKVKITNEEIDFMDGDSKVAWISNKQLHITEAEADVVNVGASLSFWGVFKWVNINGALMLVREAV